MMMPSIIECGSFIISGRSRQVPRSPSAAFTTTHLGFRLAWRASRPFMAAGARLALVGVHDDVLGLRVVLRDELPLHAGREAGAAAAAEVGVLDHGDDRVGRERQRLAEPGVAVEPLVVRDLPRLVGAEPLRQYRCERHLASSPAGLAGFASSEPEVCSGASCWLVGWSTSLVVPALLRGVRLRGDGRSDGAADSPDCAAACPPSREY